MKSFFKKVLSTSSDHFWMPGHINHCNVISMWDDFFWAVSMSVRSIRSFAVQRSSVSAQTPTCGTTDALQQTQAGSVVQGPVSNDVYFQLLLRKKTNSPRFFQKDTTLCRCRIIYPSNDFFSYIIFYLITDFVPGGLRFSVLSCPIQPYSKMLWMAIQGLELFSLSLHPVWYMLGISAKDTAMQIRQQDATAAYIPGADTNRNK